MLCYITETHSTLVSFAVNHLQELQDEMDNLQPQVEFIQELIENLTVSQLHPEPPEDLIKNLSKMRDRLAEVKETVSDLAGQIEAHTERVNQFQVQ